MVERNRKNYSQLTRQSRKKGILFTFFEKFNRIEVYIRK